MSDFLFAQPSFISGAARLVDLFGVYDEYNRSRTGQEADAKALSADWFAVSKDLLKAIEEHEQLQSSAPTPAE